MRRILRSRVVLVVPCSDAPPMQFSRSGRRLQFEKKSRLRYSRHSKAHAMKLESVWRHVLPCVNLGHPKCPKTLSSRTHYDPRQNLQESPFGAQEASPGCCQEGTFGCWHRRRRVTFRGRAGASAMINAQPDRASQRICKGIGCFAPVCAAACMLHSYENPT